MRKQDELNIPNSCLNSAEDDEPIFVLKSTDPLAALTIRFWAAARELDGKTRPEKLEEARALAEQMEAWQLAHPERLKHSPIEVENRHTTDEPGLQTIDRADMVVALIKGDRVRVVEVKNRRSFKL